MSRLLFERRWPPWLALSVVAVTALYQGFHAGQVLRHDATLPVAHAPGMGVLLAAVFMLCYRAVPENGLAAWRDRPVRLQVDDFFDETLTINTVAVANGRYFGGGMKIAPRATLDDGSPPSINAECSASATRLVTQARRRPRVLRRW